MIDVYLAPHIPTRSVQECERLVALWDEGKHDKVRKEFGGQDPTDHFLKTFRVNPPNKAPRQRKAPKNETRRV